MKKKLLFAIALMIPLAGCSCGEDFGYADNDSPEDLGAVAAPEKDVDPTTASCGDFPAGSNDPAVVESHYEVCKNASDGSCYIKTWYPVPKQGCDMQYGAYRNGNPDCFTWVHNIHDMNGTQFGPQSLAEYRVADKCALTTEAFFRSKVEKK